MSSRSATRTFDKNKAAALATTLVLAGFGCGALTQALWSFPFPPAPAAGSAEPERIAKTAQLWRKTREPHFQPDELVGHCYRPGFERHVRWREHPRGEFAIRTNNLGLREDAATSITAPPGTHRILLTGDSHTDGIVDNTESFTRLIEQLGETQPDLASLEVLNAGTGLYGPLNYAGVLRKHQNLKPQTFVVVLYVGNDFLDMVKAAALRHLIASPERSPEYLRRLEAGTEHNRAMMAQSFNQTLFFATFPDLANTVVDLIEQQIVKMRRACAKAGASMLLAFLPTKDEVEWEDPASADAILRVLELDRDALTIHRDLVERLAERIHARGLRSVDLLEKLREADEQTYWDLDWHLNVEGHKAVAQALFDELRDSIPQR